MTQVIKAHDAASFLGLMPSLLGYTPTESLVVVPFADGRSLGAMRVDLPGSTLEHSSVAQTVTGLACKLPDVDGAAAIAYTAGSVDAVRPLLDALRIAFEHCGLRVADLLYVAAEGYGSVTAGGDPQPAADIVPDPTAPTFRTGNQADGAALPDVTPEEVGDVAESLTALNTAVSAIATGFDMPEPAASETLTAIALLDDAPTLFDQALGWEPDEVDRWNAAILLWCLARPAIRDIGLITWTRGIDAGDEAFEAQLAWEGGEEYPEQIARTMWGEGERPDPHRLESGLSLARRLASLATGEAKVGALAAAAWVAWALGRSTEAEVHAVHALSIEPEHGLSEIVRSFIHAGHLPDWAFQKRSQ